MTMANETPDDSHGDTPLILPNPADYIYATAHDNETDEDIETIQPNQKILAMSMITKLRDEMAADRIETQKQIKLLQTQMTFIQTLVTGLMTHLAQSPVITRTSANVSPISRPITTAPETSMYENDDDAQASSTQTTRLQEPDDQPPITQADQHHYPPQIKIIKTANTLLTDHCLCLTNSMILPDLVHRPDPMTLNEQVNELRPISRMIAI
jgi:hypothetical protein